MAAGYDQFATGHVPRSMNQIQLADTQGIHVLFTRPKTSGIVSAIQANPDLHFGAALAAHPKPGQDYDHDDREHGPNSIFRARRNPGGRQWMTNANAPLSPLVGSHP